MSPAAPLRWKNKETLQPEKKTGYCSAAVRGAGKKEDQDAPLNSPASGRRHQTQSRAGCLMSNGAQGLSNCCRSKKKKKKGKKVVTGSHLEKWRRSRKKILFTPTLHFTTLPPPSPPPVTVSSLCLKLAAPDQESCATPGLRELGGRRGRRRRPRLLRRHRLGEAQQSEVGTSLQAQDRKSPAVEEQEPS